MRDSGSESICAYSVAGRCNGTDVSLNITNLSFVASSSACTRGVARFVPNGSTTVLLQVKVEQ